MAVISVEETTETLVAGVEPKSTAVAPDRFAPVIVTGVPPDVVPEEGETPDSWGVGGAESLAVSTRVWEDPVPLNDPAAVHMVASQETPLRDALTAPAGSIGKSSDHEVPFQDSARVSLAIGDGSYRPVAIQKDADVQDTPDRLV